MEQIQTVNGDNSVHYINLAALAVEELKKERELRMEAEHKMADYQLKMFEIPGDCHASVRYSSQFSRVNPPR